MLVKLLGQKLIGGCFAGAALLMLTAPTAQGQVLQTGLFSRPLFRPAESCPSDAGQPILELEKGKDPVPAIPTGVESSPLFAESRPPAGQGDTVALRDGNGGYIDSALIGNQLRLRLDAAYDSNRPDRAEFFYGKCGCFKAAGLDPKAPGPRLPETRVDYQDISTYAEVALRSNLSGFVEVPFRFLNPEQNANTSGLADMNLGVKYAFLQSPCQTATFQLRCYIPTGAASHGLGTDHVSLEPAFLFFQRLTDRLTLEAELRDTIPLDGTDFAGNVLRYGVGLGYTVHQTCNLRITPVVELVGWTVLGGKEFAFPENQIRDAAGDTIINAKAGVRVGLGENHSFYVGYGRALTGAVWYKDIVRAEYRLTY
jgi:hypothetical protein